MKMVMVSVVVAAIAGTAAGAPTYKPPEEQRKQFVAIETIARLKGDAQKNQVPRLYRELSDGLRSFFVEAILSAHFDTFVTDDPNPKHPFSSGPRSGRRPTAPRTPEDYATDIDDVTEKMTPEEVADAILKKHNELVLRIGARQRCMQTLAGNLDVLRPLIVQDLKSADAREIRRGLEAINDLHLVDFDDAVVDIYLADHRKDVQVSARSALWMLSTEKTIARLVADVEKEPTRIVRHEQVLNLILRERPAPPAILRLLDSKDATIRAAAADVLRYCADESLVPHVRKLAKADDAKLRASAAYMGCAQEGEAYAKVREAVLPLLTDADMNVRCIAAISLAQHKEPAAAPVLLELWGDKNVPMVHQIAITSAVRQLTGDSYGYQPAHWGPDNEPNFKAMVKLRDWIREHPAR